MTTDQVLICTLLIVTLGVLATDRWRYDIIAIMTLLVSVWLGLVPPDGAFAGFGNPAVITVAAILVLGRTVVAQGVLTAIGQKLVGAKLRPNLAYISLCTTAALLSSIMNNIGALALMLPLAMAVSREAGIPYSRILIPISFSTLLGGMITMIGTPPNLVISQIRVEHSLSPFSIFDFSPVGLVVAGVGVTFIVLTGRRILPDRGPAEATGGNYPLPRYQAELDTPKNSPFVGNDLSEIEPMTGLRINGIVRNGHFVFARLTDIKLQSGDTLRVEGEVDLLQEIIGRGDLTLPNHKNLPEGWKLREILLIPESIALGSTPASLDLPGRWGVELLAAARSNRRFEGRFSEVTLAAGDALLVAGPPDRLETLSSDLGSVPLKGRGLTFRPRRAALTAGIFVCSITIAASGVMRADAAFVLGVVVMALSGLINFAEIYRRIDWPVIVFLAALIPVGGALDSTGAATVIAHFILSVAGDTSPEFLLGLTLLLSMGLTPMLNNVATVLILAPIVLGIAEAAGLNGDPFLMAVAVGASADFLTPFGHHNNTLVLGLGGYRFLDYPRLGAPLALIVFIAAFLMIPVVWPLAP
jgi:di/tricarboxylate transporter